MRHYSVTATFHGSHQAWLHTPSLRSAFLWIAKRRAEGYKHITLTSFT